MRKGSRSTIDRELSVSQIIRRGFNLAFSGRRDIRFQAEREVWFVGVAK
jgi:hypothetical protein